ncbi:MAG: hypothetical protein U0941_21555 [Planctomycetaceae bacterium]
MDKSLNRGGGLAGFEILAFGGGPVIIAVVRYRVILEYLQSGCGKMKLSTLQSIWRAVGHIGILANIWCAVMFFVLSFEEPQKPWAGLAHELGYGFC